MSLEERLNKNRKRHPKVWGFEDWLVNNEANNFCGKRLVVNQRMHCSMHYHKLKTEAFYINTGLVYMEFNSEKGLMEPGDMLLIKPYQKHRFTGITQAEIIEFSTFHRDDDSYRESESGIWTPEEFRQICKQYEQEIKRFYLELPPVYLPRTA